MKHYFVFFSLCILLAGCKDDEDTTPFIAPQRIAVSAGPEDFALDDRNSYPRLIISCSGRRDEHIGINNFDELNITNDVVRTLPIEGLPPGQAFRPHGMDITHRDGKTWIYAVNHETDTIGSVLVFGLQADKVVLSERLYSPLIVSPNDLAVDAEGRLWVSNDRGGPDFLEENLTNPFGANILLYDGTWHVAASRLSYANGVLSLNGKVYVAATRENHLYRYDIDGDTLINKTNFANAMLGQDNITMYGDKLYVAVHTSIMDFLQHSFAPGVLSPFSIYEIDIATGEKKTVFMNDGTLISGVSAAVRYENNLYITQIFEPYIVKAVMNQ